MLRTRSIRPGIMTNEDLCALGPYAYILFTSLWMLADREGRLEDRPRRIKAMAMPMWDEVSAKDVENLVEKLAESGFIHRYTVCEQRYIQIKNWHKHQRLHHSEAASLIPPEQLLTAAESGSCDVASPRCVRQREKVGTRRSCICALVSGSGGEKWDDTTSSSASVEKTPPPLKTEHKTQRKPPASERGRASADDGPQEGEAQAIESPPEEVALMRQSLDALAHELHMPPPDDAMVRRVFEAGRGARANAVHEVLRMLYHHGKFRSMRSWGLLPFVLSDHFGRTCTLQSSA